MLKRVYLKYFKLICLTIEANCLCLAILLAQNADFNERIIVTSKDTIKSKNSNDTTQKGSTANLINDTKEELAKVVWPSRQQLLSESVAVILMVTVVATLIYLFDQIFGWLAGKVF